VCDNGAVIVYRKNRLPQEVILWSQQARIEGVRSPRLSHNGDRLVAIGIPSMRGNAMVALVRNGSTWSEQLFPPLDYVPLDLELSADGFTLAVSRQGTSANPCGCRAVVVYACRGTQGWQQAAMLHSNKRLDTPGSDNDDGFGFGRPGSHSLAVSGDGSLVAVGASLDSSDASDSVGDPANHRAPHSGAVYLFKRADDGTWQKQAFLKARAATTNDYFGHAVAVSRDGDVVFGGARGLAANAPEVNHNHALDQALPVAGANAPLTGAAAYVFQQTDGGGWIQRAAAAAPNASRAAFDSFFAMAISADTGTVVLATGEPAADNPQGMTRTVFVY
jgi:ketosteroid isomerase-like protein